ncbi:hypothetical protein [Nostoc sp.]
MGSKPRKKTGGAEYHKGIFLRVATLETAMPTAGYAYAHTS